MARRTANKHIKRHCKLLNYSDSLSDITSPCSLTLQSRKCLQIGGSIFLAWCSSIQQYSNQQYSIGSTAESKWRKIKMLKKPHNSPLFNWYGAWRRSQAGAAGTMWYASSIVTVPLLQYAQKKVLFAFLFPFPNSGGATWLAVERQWSNWGGDVWDIYLYYHRSYIVKP